MNDWGNKPSTLDIQLHDTLFVIGNVHLTIFDALLFLFFSVFYCCYPPITGKNLNAPLSYIHFTFTLVSTCLLSWPAAHYEGLAGMPRRYIDYPNWVNLSALPEGNPFTTKMIILFLFGQLIFIVNLIYSAFASPSLS